MNNGQQNPHLGAHHQDAPPRHDLMSLFETLTFREKWRRVFAGLRMPVDAGLHKYARLQLLRLLSPAGAIIVPLLALVLLVLLADLTRTVTARPHPIDLHKPEPVDELDPVPPPDVILPVPDEPLVTALVDSPAPAPGAREVSPQPLMDHPQPATLVSHAPVYSPLRISLVNRPQTPGEQGEALAAGDGLGTETAVLRALRWLRTTQHDDGSWGRNRTAMTALAVLAYLGYGETPASPEFGETIEKAIRFLLDAQQADGRFRFADGHDYTTPIAAYALSETYAITRIPMVKYAAEKAMSVVIRGQNAHGGFNYNLRGPEDTRNDLSYTAWCVQALKAAQIAQLGVEGLGDAMARAVAGVKRNHGGADGYGGFAYTAPGRSGLTGAGALSLQFLGRPDDPETRSAIAWLSRNAVVTWNAGEIDSTHRRDPVYYWYYATQAMFQQGGSTWTGWNNQFKPALMHSQTDHPERGE